MARTGYKVTVYLDDNPNSSGYMETYEERVLDERTCPISEDDLVLVATECEIVFSGRTGYRINIYYNRTTGEYQQTRELDPECEASTDEEIWVPSGDPFCETTEQGVNTGYMAQLVVQMNQLLPNYGETKYNRWMSPECGANNCAIWDDLQQQCHISVINCVATFDGTADITQIDINPLSATYNQTRTINKQDSNCENCTQTTFSWELVGDMCGNDELLCSNGLQQVSTNSYTVHRKYKTIGNSTPVPMDEYQIVLKIEDDEDCGYIRPIYEMRRMPGEYLCDFETYTKYEKYSQYVSYDSGVTWSLVSPEVSERGDVIAYDSYDCGKPMYRWVFNGEYLCEDNGDDGKLIYWDSNGVMVSASPCSDSSILDNKTMNEVTSGITSPDGYKDTYQVGDCVDEIADNVFQYFTNNSKLWLGNYTEKIGYNTLCGYDRQSLDIPERVNDMSHRSFGYTSWSSGHWSYNCGHDNFRVLVMHPTTPPTIVNYDDVPALMVYNPRSTNLFNGSVIFVPFEAYDSYSNANIWSDHVNSERGRLLPMNNDTDSHKAILEYESDFSTWRYYVPDGESASTIGVEEHIYGIVCITGVTITDKVTGIADSTFNSAGLKTLDLGNSVETIGYRAFYNNELTSLHIPGSVRTIGSEAFNNQYHTISSITFDDGVETIGSYAFYGCRCSAITLPDSVKTIGEYAFYYNTMNRLEIGSGCTSIGSRIVKGVDTLVVKALIPPTVSEDSFGYNSTPSEILVPCESLNIYREQWSNFEDRIFGIEPCDGNVYKVYAVNSEGKTLRRACVGTGLTLTGSDTGGLRDMVSVIVGDCVTAIGDFCFNNCTELTGVSLSDTITSFGNYSFSSLNLPTFRIPLGLTSTTVYTFYDTQVENLIVPNLQMTFSYDTKPFTGLSVTNESIDMEIVNSYNVPQSVINLSVTDRARVILFDNYQGEMNLSRLNSSVDGYFNIPSSVTSITLMCSAMTHCVFESDSQLETIEYRCFESSNLVYVNIPSGVTSIGTYAFYGCSGLTSLDLPEGITSIGQYAFRDCTGMQSLTVRAVVPPLVSTDTFYNMGGTVYVPAVSLEAYKAAWSWISDRIQPIP